MAGPGELSVVWTDWEGRDGDQAGIFARRAQVPLGDGVSIPTQSPAGALALVVLLGAAALLALRRLRGAGAHRM